MTRLIVGLAAVLAVLAPLREARADYHLFSPYEIDLGELEIEHNGDAVFDRRPDQKGAASYTLELGTGLTPWWHSEIEFGWDRDPGGNQPTLLTQVVTENMIQLTEPGEYFVDSGFYVEYGQSMTRGAAAGPNEITFGPVFGKDIGRTTSLVNLFLTRQLGPDQTSHGLDFSYAWQTRWNLWTPLSPAVEIYGDAGELGHMPRLLAAATAGRAGGDRAAELVPARSRPRRADQIRARLVVRRDRRVGPRHAALAAGSGDSVLTARQGHGTAS